MHDGVGDRSQTGAVLTGLVGELAGAGWTASYLTRVT